MIDMRDHLRRWGEATVNRFQRIEHSGHVQVHALDRAREYAPGTRARAAVRLAGRNGHSRLMIMGYAAGLTSHSGKRTSPAPEWVCDPIPCTDTRKRTPRESIHDAAKSSAMIDLGIPDHLRWIDDKINRIGKQKPILAQVLHAEYTTPGTQKMKAGALMRRFGGEVTSRQYRELLSRAMLALELV